MNVKSAGPKSATASKMPDEIKELTFEAALAELEDIVSRLEGGKVGLEDSIAIYERGAALKAHCESKLKSAQARVDKIVIGSRGEVTTESADFS